MRAAPEPTPLPTFAASLQRGILGFTFVSVAGFLPWPIFDQWFRGLREMHLYAACTAARARLRGH